MPEGRRFPAKRGPGPRHLRVFLSYRREDASGHAGRLYDLLASRYGAERVFMDIDAIPLGSEFGEAISRAVASCDVVIVLIGRAWLQATDSDGRRRLEDPDDFVRREIESALAQEVVVVPACVQGAEIPSEQELPASLAPLTRRQGFQLSDTGWQDDVGRLIRRLEAVAGERPDSAAAAADSPAPERRPGRRGRALTAAGLCFLALLALLVGVLTVGGGEDGGDASPQEASEEAPPLGDGGGRGALTLGSDLRIAATEERWYCTGVGADAPPCSYVLARLPDVDRPIRAPFDGVVTRWQVREAGGPIRAIVVRGEFTPGGRSSLVRVEGSVEQQVTGDGPKSFRTRLAVERGDAVGLQLSRGAYVNAPYSEGAWLEKWIPPLSGEPQSSLETSERDYEVLYNATVERDRDGDGFGDTTQDRCPKDRRRQKGC